jgi:hypothetical protein
MSTSPQFARRAGHLPPDCGKRAFKLAGCRTGRRSDLLFVFREAAFQERVWDSSHSPKCCRALLNHVRLVNEADDAHFALALPANKRVRFIDFADEVGPRFGPAPCSAPCAGYSCGRGRFAASAYRSQHWPWQSRRRASACTQEVVGIFLDGAAVTPPHRRLLGQKDECAVHGARA